MAYRRRMPPAWLLLLLALLVIFPLCASAAPQALLSAVSHEVGCGADNSMQTAAPALVPYSPKAIPQPRTAPLPGFQSPGGMLRPLILSPWCGAASSALHTPFPQHLLIPHSIHAPPQSQI